MYGQLGVCKGTGSGPKVQNEQILLLIGQCRLKIRARKPVVGGQIVTYCDCMGRGSACAAEQQVWTRGSSGEEEREREP